MSVSQWGRVLVDEMDAAEVPAGQMWIWPLGGPSLAVKTARSTVLIDPYTGSPTEGPFIRMVAVPYDPADLRGIDAVLSTHCHDDHCHRDTLLPLAENTDARFYGPSTSTDRMKEFGLPEDRIVTAEDGDVCETGDVTIIAEKLTDFADPAALGWVLSAKDGPTLVDGGDAIYNAEFADIGRRYDVDAATLSVAGLADGEKIYMDPSEVVLAATDLGADLLIPKHWDLWRNVYLDPWEVVVALMVQRCPIGIHLPRLGGVIKLGE